MTARADSPGIRIAEVSHRYRKHTALDTVSLDLPPGRLVGFIGPDGVGKSTLLGLVTGAKKLQAGTIDVLGGPIGDAAHRRRICPAIAFMPQGLGRNLYPELSVRENLEFFSRLFGQGAAEREARIASLLTATGLAPFEDRLMGRLSGGMKQKLGLCCALIHDPKLLVLDEPTTGVDPLSRRQFWALIGAIRKTSPGLTVLVSTAYMEEAQSFDWIVAMDAGRVLYQGPPDDLKRQTGDLETAYRQLRANGSPPPVQHPAPAAHSGEPVITARGLTRRFGDFTAVDHVDFSIARGEIFGFLGSNGCGKSTTMKMLTGLLPISSGEAQLFGKPVDARNRALRREIGYMSQAFSLYGELTVEQNLQLHARIFGIKDRAARVAELTRRFGLEAHSTSLAAALPLGIKQRLSLAVAVIHRPRVLILDEPTSGVDPGARDMFWALLLELSRNDGVTIFVSTHFMGEAERCDRVSFMHAGKVLAEGTPKALMASQVADTLEQAFVSILRAADPPAPVSAPETTVQTKGRAAGGLTRALAYARRETVEVLRDPVRLAFAFLGSVILMLVFCFGISLDIDELDYAALDLSQSPESRAYLAEISGSRYFRPAPPLASAADGRKRLVSGEVSLVVELPPDFGRKLRANEPAEVLAIVDGAIPFKGETVEGYAAGLHQTFLSAEAAASGIRQGETARIEPRFRYNQSFESIAAMAPAMPAILLIMLPAVLMAVSVAREKELGSVTNFYVTPTTRLEFLIGKQIPYIVIAYLNFLLLTVMTIAVFGVPLKGDPLPLALGALLYVWAATSYGLLIATMTSSQVAATFATTIASVVPTIQFSGLLQPVSTLEPGAQTIGALWPSSYFLHLNVGAFTKGLGWEALLPDILALACFGPALTLLAALALRAQEK
ncbi:MULTISPECIES: ribosome-associated ATPase/putative transporter RbbA [unclassified Leisingera]|uniref:ribosome-associated ATPase/putative transporter RbbA n=1 Tax=unclassified Leisingera TaxID=2614906 RepID=UPI0003156CCA|nr:MULTISPECIES: ribosome-associated ATPase/putative transporter RbbA [unclassified Leisingera]KIC23653.1 multidrug ABC transporter ATP-binding protein [Leisingera sp. ANG-S3]KIC52224.1 multidrug ABC transporter ATP-binding protein [Leisingera sp. ANG-S]KID09782.1 multidrug ABC transporter ATP-binding protein [Leisingera sp. ANG1]